MKRISNKRSKNKKYNNFRVKIEKSEIKRKSILKRISVFVIENPVEQAINSYNKNNPDNLINCSVNRKTISRITYNFLRHKYSNYEVLISRLGLCKKRHNLFQFKKDTNNFIEYKYGKNFIIDEIKELREIRSLCCI